MNCDKKIMRLYAITDRAWVGKMTLLEQVEAALKNGVSCLQLREKDLDKEAFLAEAKEIAILCRNYHVPFIINDNVELAIKCGADGIHVGQEDMLVSDVRSRVGSQMIIGVSAHSVEEAIEAEKNGADYIGAGAVFSTSTKTDVDRMPFKTLKEICKAVEIPVVAIGGISKNNVLELSGSGIDGIAVISAIFAADDPAEATRELLKLSNKMVKYNE